MTNMTGKPARISIGLSELFTTATRETSEIKAQTAGKAARPRITTVELSGSITTFDGSCIACGKRTITRIADFLATMQNSATHTTACALQFEGFKVVCCSKHMSQMRALNSNGAALLSDIFAAWGCNTSIQISKENERFVTTSSGCVIMIPAICRGTSI